MKHLIVKKGNVERTIRGIFLIEGNKRIRLSREEVTDPWQDGTGNPLSEDTQRTVAEVLEIYAKTKLMEKLTGKRR